MTTPPAHPGAETPEAVTGVHLMQGVGVAPAKGFWADAWSYVLRRPGAIFGLAWTGIVVFFAVFAPLIASGRPWVYQETGGPRWSPLLYYLNDVDLVMLAGTLVGLPLVILPLPGKRSDRARALLAGAVQVGVTLVILALTKKHVDPGAIWGGLLPKELGWLAPYLWSAVIAAAVALCLLWLPGTRGIGSRLLLALVAATLAAWAAGYAWVIPISETRYAQEVAAGRAVAWWTLIPRSPTDRSTELSLLPPGANVEGVAIREFRRVLRRAGGPNMRADDVPLMPDIIAQVPRAAAESGLAPERAGPLVDRISSAYLAGTLHTGADLIRLTEDTPGPRFILGTDAFGQDVLSQMLHACRLAISIGLVSTGIAVLIGITLGSVMGYFGGLIDLVLFRFVEIMMAVPVLFLLILAAAVLPEDLRTTYTMMAIIGAFTWTGAARFTRAEFLKMRHQDFVQSCRAVGLPLRSTLFRHMLPNGVTPVLVDASFSVAAAIVIEATLSYLGLGPVDQASWGRLLASAYNQVGTFQWWLAIFPGAAIFLTVLGYNMIGEALRDAIDPKLKKARV
ncbi:MAG: ABC transporter permease [Phycisphaerales bacterium]|nr:ABC transporter permease [Phycisphaerales bacterium]